MKWILVGTAAGSLAVGGGWYWYQHGPCGKSPVVAGVAAMNAEQRRFQEGVALLSSTPVMLAAQQVKNLYDIKRELEARALPECLSPARSQLVAWMGAVIEAANLQIQAMLGPTHQGLPEETMERHRSIIDGFATAYGKRAITSIECAPFCG